ncbi:MAG: hypothetical protein JOZ69_10580 [Myxococcales bacterium]|nr:hypothetical protein [Myxococcales bacterium]
MGAAGALTGVGVWSADTNQVTNGRTVSPTGPVLVLGGLLVELIGSVIVLQAQPHLFDAINAYNDARWSPPPAPSPSAVGP